MLDLLLQKMFQIMQWSEATLQRFSNIVIFTILLSIENTVTKNMHNKILHLIETKGPGGAETVFLQLVEEMTVRGYICVAENVRDSNRRRF